MSSRTAKTASSSSSSSSSKKTTTTSAPSIAPSPSATTAAGVPPVLSWIGRLWSLITWLVYLPISIADTVYHDIFLGQVLLYNISFEDARIDRDILDVKGKVVLTLTSAGDNVLDALTEGASKVIAVDQNLAQCALMELKIAAFKTLSYDQVWAIFGECNGDMFRAVYHTSLRPLLSPNAAAYWDARPTFIDNLYYNGGSGWAAWLFVHVFCRATGLYSMLMDLLKARSLDEQRAIYATWRPYFHRVLAVLYYFGLWRWFAWLAAVPTNQQSLLSTNWEHYFQDVIDHLSTRTWLAGENHYFSIYILGRYYKNNCPRYLQEQWFAHLRDNIDRIEVRCGNLFHIMRDLGTSKETRVDRFNLLDHMDWMDESAVLTEWSYISNCAAPGALAMWKSISEISSPNVLSFLATPSDAQAKIDAFMPVDFTPTYRSVRLVRVPTPDQFVLAPRDVPNVGVQSLSTDVQVLIAMYLLPTLRKFGLIHNPAAAASTAAAAPAAPAHGKLTLSIKEMKAGSVSEAGSSLATGAIVDTGSVSQSRTAMNTFYAPQANLYDSYRHRMLHGRPLMAACMPLRKGGVWVDVGGGTGFNLEYVASNMSAFSRVYVVDVCDPLLAQAEQRVKARGWSNVRLVRRDVCKDGILSTADEPEGVDLITFSYSLTMIPEWQAALEAAHAMLKPGGYIAITDFTVLPTPFQNSVAREFFTRVFAVDGVHLRLEHRQMLAKMFVPCVNEVRFGGFPYVPRFLASPYYVFVGQKAKEGETPTLVQRYSPSAPSRAMNRALSHLMLAEASLAN